MASVCFLKIYFLGITFCAHVGNSLVHKSNKATKVYCCYLSFLSKRRFVVPLAWRRFKQKKFSSWQRLRKARAPCKNKKRSLESSYILYLLCLMCASIFYLTTSAWIERLKKKVSPQKSSLDLAPSKRPQSQTRNTMRKTSALVVPTLLLLSAACCSVGGSSPLLNFFHTLDLEEGQLVDLGSPLPVENKNQPLLCSRTTCTFH